MPSTTSSLPLLDLAAVASLIEHQEVSPVEVTEAALARIEGIDQKLNAFISVTGEKALLAAEAAAKAIAAGYYLGPLHGVPLALKDIISTRGDISSSGSKILRDFVPSDDATVAARLRASGAILLGKLNMHEFAYGVTTNNPHYGACWNAWNQDRTPGGSSGGAGAAVAARLCYGALGTDTGCSVRLPAAFNGTAGIRPTIGRVSNYGVSPLAWTLDTVGPLARTVFDCALILEAIAGHDSRDPQTFNVPVQRYSEIANRGLSGTRLALIKGYSLAGCQAGVLEAMGSVLDVLRSAGVKITEVDVPDLEYAISALMTVDVAEPSAYHAEWLRSRPGDYGTDVRGMLEAGELYLASHYIQAQRFRSVISAHFRDAMRDVDAILTPSVGFTAPHQGDTEVVLASGEVTDIISAVMRYHALPPLAGLPALSVPCGFASDGLPVGFQVMGRAFDEGMLFRIGHGYQQLTDWHVRVPDI